MTDRKRSDGLLALLLIFLAGKGGNWLITPMRHPDATRFEYAMTWAQVVVCLAVALWLIGKARSAASAT
jgi:hypothetical protein